MSETSIARRILEAARTAGEAALATERARQAEALQEGIGRIDAEISARRMAAEKRLRETQTIRSELECLSIQQVTVLGDNAVDANDAVWGLATQ